MSVKNKGMIDSMSSRQFSSQNLSFEDRKNYFRPPTPTNNSPVRSKSFVEKKKKAMAAKLAAA